MYKFKYLNVVPSKKKSLHCIGDIIGVIMSQSKLKNIRPLGSVRSKISLEKNAFHIPNWNSKQLEKGVQGSAITITPQTQEPQSSGYKLIENNNNPERPTQEKRQTTSKDDEISHEGCKKEIDKLLKSEKCLRDQVQLLEQQKEEQEIKLKLTEDKNEQLQKDLKEQEQHWMNELMHEKDLHQSTQVLLEDTRKEMQQAKESFIQMMELQRDEMNRQIMTLEGSLTEKDSIINDRDQKLNKLKTQMADALKGNSWERQQQLEELTKELARVQKEYDTLHIKFKTLSRSQQSSDKSSKNV